MWTSIAARGTVTAAVALADPSAALVATTCQTPGATGVYRPASVINPPDAPSATDQTTRPSEVPPTRAANCCELPSATMGDWGSSMTVVRVRSSTVTVAVPDCRGSALLVAVIWAVPARSGAVKSPVPSIEPASADQVTSFRPPVTTAANCCVPPAGTPTEPGTTTIRIGGFPAGA